MKSTCKACGGTVTEHVIDEGFIYKGRRLTAPVEYSVCTSCGREFITYDQIIRNEEHECEARASIDTSFSE